MQTLSYSYEKAGLRVADEPIPWNAEAVLFEARIQFPPHLGWSRSDLHLRMPLRPPVLAMYMHPVEQEGVFRVLFRLPPLHGATTASLYCRESLLGQVSLPYLPADQFLRNLRLQAPMIFASLGQHNVACQAFVEGQCRGLSACGILTSPTSLLPITEWSLTAEFTDQEQDAAPLVAIPLTSSQLLTREALLTVIPPAWSRPLADCSVRWRIGGRVLAERVVQGISQAEFQRSLYLVEARYLYQDAHGAVIYSHHLPARESPRCLQPCFLVASRRKGMAGHCSFQIRVRFRDPTRSPLLLDHEVLVTDGPSLCLPAPLALEDIHQVRAFELCSRGQIWDPSLSAPPPWRRSRAREASGRSRSIPWSPVAEEELLDRLQRLMDVPVQGEL